MGYLNLLLLILVRFGCIHPHPFPKAHPPPLQVFYKHAPSALVTQQASQNAEERSDSNLPFTPNMTPQPQQSVLGAYTFPAPSFLQHVPESRPQFPTQPHSPPLPHPQQPPPQQSPPQESDSTLWGAYTFPAPSFFPFLKPAPEPHPQQHEIPFPPASQPKEWMISHSPPFLVPYYAILLPPQEIPSRGEGYPLSFQMPILNTPAYQNAPYLHQPQSVPVYYPLPQMTPEIPPEENQTTPMSTEDNHSTPMSTTTEIQEEELSSTTEISPNDSAPATEISTPATTSTMASLYAKDALQEEGGIYSYAPGFENYSKIELLKHEIKPNGNGYSIEFKTETGIQSKEEGALKLITLLEGADNHLSSGQALILIKSGEVSWTSPECSHITLKYIADEKGYHPQISQQAQEECLNKLQVAEQDPK